MADAGNESAGDSCHHAMIIEIVLTLLHLFLIQHTEVAPTAVGEAIDDRAAEIVTCQIVDRSAAVGSSCRKENDQPNVEITGGRVVGRGSNHQLRWYRDDCTLKQHQQENRPIVEVSKKRR